MHVTSTVSRLSKRSLRLSLGLAAAAVALAIADPSSAQQAGTMSPGAIAWSSGGCTACHGSIGQGGKGGEQPAGPNLWTTALDRDGLKETIACGRPSTGMPFNIAGAYKQRACFGLPLGDPPAEVPPGASLTAAQLDTLVDFLVTKVVRKGPINKAKCAAFFGDNLASPVCAPFPN